MDLGIAFLLGLVVGILIGKLFFDDSKESKLLDGGMPKFRNPPPPPPASGNTGPL